ncbi:hypothetical protein [Streptomyces koelreuteriae]|uniref:hypothetical protein n=1 Tax=Streptomyces koelreuteriae TaxID=2838015 RepID=UPI003EBA6CBD
MPALRTESSTFYVNPEGSVTEESSTGPIRVKDEKGAWRDVDTTLVLRDGVVQPKRAAADITISAGGSGPLAQVGEGSQSLGIGWEGALPEPVLQGNTATYENVQPGADLVVSALPEGFSGGRGCDTPSDQGRASALGRQGRRGCGHRTRSCHVGSGEARRFA